MEGTGGRHSGERCEDACMGKPCAPSQGLARCNLPQLPQHTPCLPAVYGNQHSRQQPAPQPTCATLAATASRLMLLSKNERASRGAATVIRSLQAGDSLPPSATCLDRQRPTRPAGTGRARKEGRGAGRRFGVPAVAWGQMTACLAARQPSMPAQQRHSPMLSCASTYQSLTCPAAWRRQGRRPPHQHHRPWSAGRPSCMPTAPCARRGTAPAGTPLRAGQGGGRNQQGANQQGRDIMVHAHLPLPACVPAQSASL